MAELTHADDITFEVIVRHGNYRVIYRGGLFPYRGQRHVHRPWQPDRPWWTTEHVFWRSKSARTWAFIKHERTTP